MNTWTLLRRLWLRKAVRSFTRGKPEQQLQYVAFALLGAMVFSGALWLASLLFGGLRFAQMEEGAPAIVASVYTAAALMLIFVGMGTAVHTLYLSRDLQMLMSMPISPRTILSYKFLEILLGDVVVFCLLGLPVLVAYALVHGAGPLFYILVLPVSACLLTIPTSLSILLVLPAMRLLPVGRAREIVAALSGLVGVGAWTALQVFSRGEAGTGAIQTVRESPASRVPPGAWAADAVVGAATGEWGLLLGGLLPLSICALGLWLGCMAVAQRAYTTGWARTAETGRKVRGRGWARGLFRWLPPGVRAVVTKDLTTLPRDIRQLAGLGSLPFMGLVLAALNRPEGGAGEVFGLGRAAPYLLAAGFAATSTMQLGLMSIGGEGRTYWVLAASPLGVRQIILGKWISAFTVGTVSVLLGATAASVFGFYAPGLALGIALGILAAAVLSTYAVGISAAFPRFDWENPKQATSSAGTWLLAGVMMGLLVWAGMMAGLAAALNTLLPLWSAVLVAVLGWVAGAAVPGYALYRTGRSNLEGLEWEF